MCVYMYTYMHMYIHTHMYTHTQRKTAERQTENKQSASLFGERGNRVQATMLEAGLGNYVNVLHNYESKLNKKEKDNP